MSVVLEVEDVVQEYPGVRALTGVSLSLSRGQVLGLVGENGAGKSTLIRILGGLEPPVSGAVRVHGQERHFKGSAESQAAGISVVSQEFRLVPQLSVADNILLGHELTTGGVVRRAESRSRVLSLLAQLGMHLEPDRPVSSLTVGDRQMVEIARALSREFDILIMDEPTAALNGAEITRLHAIVRRLAEQGKSVIYVSHHLEEIFVVCDDVAVLRDGSLVLTAPTASLDEPQLVEHMLGRRPESFERAVAAVDDDGALLPDGAPDGVAEGGAAEGEAPRTSAASGGAASADDGGAPFRGVARARVRLAVEDLGLPGFDEPFSLRVERGEILGLAGLVGSGRTELTRALFGDLPARSGIVAVDGQRVHLGSSTQAIAAGLFMLSEDRKSEGILPHLDVTENAMASRNRRALPLRERLLPSRASEAALFAELRESMRIRVPHGRQLIGNLSGGNQQKVLFGRAVVSGCRVLLLNEPTRGVDVGAKIEIYQLIRRLAGEGVGIVVSSSDAPELAAIADRCLVYFAGRMVAELRGRSVTEDAIVAASVGQMAEGDVHV